MVIFILTTFLCCSAKDSFTIKGKVVDFNTEKPLIDAHVSMEQFENTRTNEKGDFILKQTKKCMLDVGDVKILKVSKNKYECYLDTFKISSKNMILPTINIRLK